MTLADNRPKVQTKATNNVPVRAEVPALRKKVADAIEKIEEAKEIIEEEGPAPENDETYIETEDKEVTFASEIYECDHCGAEHMNEGLLTCNRCSHERESGDLNDYDHD